MTDLFALLLAAQHGGGSGGKTVKWSSIVANDDGTFTATDSEGVDHTLSYTADAAGKITAITLDGVTKTVTYDDDGNVIKIGNTDVDLTDMPAPSGTISITENGEYNVAEYETAKVNVESEAEMVVSATVTIIPAVMIEPAQVNLENGEIQVNSNIILEE